MKTKQHCRNIKEFSIDGIYLIKCWIRRIPSIVINSNEWIALKALTHQKLRRNSHFAQQMWKMHIQYFSIFDIINILHIGYSLGFIEKYTFPRIGFWYTAWMELTVNKHSLCMYDGWWLFEIYPTWYQSSHNFYLGSILLHYQTPLKTFYVYAIPDVMHL